MVGRTTKNATKIANELVKNSGSKHKACSRNCTQSSEGSVPSSSNNLSKIQKGIGDAIQMPEPGQSPVYSVKKNKIALPTQQ